MLAENLENLVKKERLAGMQAGRQAGREEGMQAGQLEAKRAIAKKLVISTSMDDRAIAEISELPVAEIAALRGESAAM